ncbi:hypothetical protein A3SI_18021 [Nitritalea halalkaliphila LW7]|uniref:Uncharacterized protein n=1 Tax=Nitritalea halalkaliphila LW7 TaxID=1189621 RepID=I5BV15_9BACT|nr:hypothetical protein A3SI_18021 [Nitritalea halalkaliphila LW7]
MLFIGGISLELGCYSVLQVTRKYDKTKILGVKSHVFHTNNKLSTVQHVEAILVYAFLELVTLFILNRAWDQKGFLRLGAKVRQSNGHVLPTVCVPLGIDVSASKQFSPNPCM